MKLNFVNEMDYWSVWNKKKEKLGYLYYCNEWETWAWEQSEDIIMSLDCLIQVTDFLKELNKNQPKGNKYMNINKNEK